MAEARTQAFDTDRGALVFTGDNREASTTIEERWTMGGVCHGGFLLALMVEALRHGLRHTRLVTVSGHFLAPVRPGEAKISVHMRREGKSASSVVGTLTQQARPHVTCTATFVDEALAEHPVSLLAGRPELPGACSCVELPTVLPGRRMAPIMNEVEVRLSTADAGWLDGAPSGMPRMAGWIRHRGGRELDDASLVLASDLLPPAVRNLGVSGWLPTIQLTVHIRSAPEGTWLAAAAESTAVSPRFLNDVVHLWDASGALVADAYQLRASRGRS
ncbi:acyl-CoA thioesterase [Kibdelosporangium banguiense]|uniref:Acyl-CoA thioesterase n=1 Tax=Kibdelosporangium banguiense TaxID=1365924 RepID=A0ABS4TXZ1_9PSEU|nr:thioesterase family protein [Kibdelosporangium banguiense]MBP2329268.1 acyl-CoA thioesterase [Kibdelosporangium banguiense]